MSSPKRPRRHSIDISEEDGVRYLHFGSDWVQGAMRIARPWSLELAYTREMMAGLILRASPPKSILQVGLGAGSISKFAYRYLPECQLTVVEISPQVEFAARQYFKLPDDDRRLQVIHADGAEFMLSGHKTYDWIMIDGFDPQGRAGVLDTLPFYQACRARLSENGLFVVNLLGRDRGFQASRERIAEAFDNQSIVFPSCDSGNTIAFAHAGTPVDVELDTLRARASQLKTETRLDLLPTLTRIQLSAAFPDGRLRF